jgi:D-glycero-alpha-D-manno-heptose-7-phosphate kinase
MTNLAQELRSSLGRDDLESFGEILDEGWRLKQQLAQSISNQAIDGWYATARQHGAKGGKLLGAGGGGFLLLYACPEHQAAIINALPELRPFPIKFEPQGSKIIYVEEGN